jgi:hypothetical protein
MEDVNRKVMEQAGIGKNVSPYSKNNKKAKTIGAEFQVAEHLPTKHEAISSNPSTTRIFFKKPRRGIPEK